MKRFPSYLSLKSIQASLRRRTRSPHAAPLPNRPAPTPERASESREPLAPLVLAVINNKGGVGKTTTAVSLAAALSIKHTVLLVDLDSQGSATISIDHRRLGDPGSTLSDVFSGRADLHEVIRTSPISGLDYIAGGTGLIEANKYLAAAPPTAFHRLLAPLRERYTFILLDCAPTFTALSHNALVAADGCLVPLMPHYLALQGLENLREVMQQVDTPEAPIAPLWGILLTMADDRDPYLPDRIRAIRDRYEGLVFDTVLPIDPRLAEAPASGQSIFAYAHRSAGAHFYWQLSKEVIERSHATEPEQ
jgi:chromosome partitioning protein